MTSTLFEFVRRLSLALACFSTVPAIAADQTPAEPLRVDFKHEKPGPEARSLADRVLASDDHGRRPFAIVDKALARVYVFDAQGHLIDAAPALLGIAVGDHTAPGIGTMELSAIRMQDRTTPAGRFEAAIGRNDKGKEILWVDYDSAISMHPVIDTNKKERRPQRLATPTPKDNRISFGCINVPIPFFQNVVARTFRETSGIVYVLPETLPPDSPLLRFPGPTSRSTAAQ